MIAFMRMVIFACLFDFCIKQARELDFMTPKA